VIPLSDTVCTARNAAEGEFIFEISTSYRTFTLKASSQLEVSEWLEAIRVSKHSADFADDENDDAAIESLSPEFSLKASLLDSTSSLSSSSSPSPPTAPTATAEQSKVRAHTDGASTFTKGRITPNAAPPALPSSASASQIPDRQSSATATATTATGTGRRTALGARASVLRPNLQAAGISLSPAPSPPSSPSPPAASPSPPAAMPPSTVAPTISTSSGGGGPGMMTGGAQRGTPPMRRLGSLQDGGVGRNRPSHSNDAIDRPPRHTTALTSSGSTTRVATPTKMAPAIPNLQHQQQHQPPVRGTGFVVGGGRGGRVGAAGGRGMGVARGGPLPTDGAPSNQAAAPGTWQPAPSRPAPQRPGAGLSSSAPKPEHSTLVSGARSNSPASPNQQPHAAPAGRGRGIRPAQRGAHNRSSSMDEASIRQATDGSTAPSPASATAASPASSPSPQSTPPAATATATAAAAPSTSRGAAPSPTAPPSPVNPEIFTGWLRLQQPDETWQLRYYVIINTSICQYRNVCLTDTVVHI
jgi:hypothetical protein